MNAQNQTPAFDYDIAIVGGGIAGATLAACLNNSGLKVALIEAQSQEAAASKQQVYAITLLSGEIFKGIGIWEKIREKIAGFSEINLSDTGKVGALFYPGDLKREEVGYAGEHSAILPVLQEFINTCSNVSWFCPAQVAGVSYYGDFAEIELLENSQSKRIKTRLVVAADGARSPIREAAGIRTNGWKYWQSCITTRIKPEKAHKNVAYERFWPSGPFAILPLPNNRCNIVWTAPHAEAKAMMELSDEGFLAELKQRYGEQMGNIELEGERRIFNVQLMQSECYVLPRLALIGDAAHCCHPVGGQGLNMGIRDAAALAEVLRKAHQKGEDIGALKVLKKYEGWRKFENLVILGFTDLLDRMFSNKFMPLVLLRQLGLWVLRKVGPVKVLALRLMTGLLGRMPEVAQR
ncbi:FAD-dependent hydroxylase [Ancylothrix sp. C2]|uniref:FAD-dependent hydroxylase n=1 Tax=Ancylothrix sp. D3o TaxID=2953691 RepID=UPI0021BAC8C7|nr:FAD-dependent hydroxylase [Ancylothrix sp. D3o]MCT7952007.1 FAD-dependent hydroxylase [Ancylothrix sp. D3o]